MNLDFDLIVKVATFGLTILNMLVILFYLVRKRRKAETQEEKDQIDEVIRGTLAVALNNIKTNLNALSLRFDGTKTIKNLKLLIKEDKRRENAQETK